MKLLLFILMVISPALAQQDESSVEWALWAERQQLPQAKEMLERVIASPDASPLSKAKACRQLALIALEDDQPDLFATWTQQAAEWADNQTLPTLDKPKGPKGIFPVAGRKRYDDEEDIRFKLANIIVPKISLENQSLMEATDEIVRRSMSLDIEGEGICILLSPMGDFDEITITLDFDNMPLKEIIDYICKGADLVYEFMPFGVGVIILEKNAEYESMRFETIDLYAGEVLAGSEFADDDSETPSLKDFCASLGVTYPPGAWISELPEAGKLITYNTPDNLRRTSEIFRGFFSGPFMQELVCRVLEVRTPSVVEIERLEIPRTEDLLKREHRWLAKRSLKGLLGEELKLEDAHGMSFEATRRSDYGVYRYEMVLKWSWKTPERRTISYQGPLNLVYGRQVALPLEQLGDVERFLVVSTHLFDMSGRSLEQ